VNLLFFLEVQLSRFYLVLLPGMQPHCWVTFFPWDSLNTVVSRDRVVVYKTVVQLQFMVAGRVVLIFCPLHAPHDNKGAGSTVTRYNVYSRDGPPSRSNWSAEPT